MKSDFALYQAEIQLQARKALKKKTDLNGFWKAHIN